METLINNGIENVKYFFPFLRMLETDVGEILAKVNEPTACVISKHEILDIPHFLKRPVDTYIVGHRNGMIEARVTGTPKPEIKWYKNWHHITEGPRYKVICLSRLSDVQNHIRNFIEISKTHFRCITTNPTRMHWRSRMQFPRTQHCTLALHEIALDALHHQQLFELCVLKSRSIHDSKNAFKVLMLHAVIMPILKSK